MIGRVNKNGGTADNDITNSVIAQYKAQNDTINANTFVEWANKIEQKAYYGLDIEDGYATMYPNIEWYVGGTVIEYLTDTKILITFNADLTGGENPHFYVAVVTIDNEEVTFSTPALINNNPNYMRDDCNKIAVLSDTKAAITFPYDCNNDDFRIRGVVISISGTTITVGSAITIVTRYNSAYYQETVALSENSFVVAHMYGSSSASDTINTNLYCIICTVSGTTITKGTDTAIYPYGTSYPRPKIIAINSNSFVIIYRGEWGVTETIIDYMLMAVPCTVSGTTLTKGSSTWLSIFYDEVNDFSAVLMNENGIFAVFELKGGHTGSSDTRLEGIYFSVSNNVITLNVSEKMLDPTITSNDRYICVGKVSENRACLVWRQKTTFSKMTIYEATADKIEERGTEIILNNIIKRIYNVNNYLVLGFLDLWYFEVDPTDRIKPAEEDDKVMGVTKTIATENDFGDVNRLKPHSKFFIKLEKFYKDEDMTWKDWITSNYNSIGLTIRQTKDGNSYCVGVTRNTYLANTVYSTIEEVEELEIVENSNYTISNGN